MAISGDQIKEYDHPCKTVVRTQHFFGLGGAASTAYGLFRVFQASIVRAVHFYVNVADAAGSTWRAYYRPADTPDGSADVALGSAWTVGAGAAGTTKTIVLRGLTASGDLAVNSKGYPVLNAGDAIVVKTGASNDTAGRVDICYEWQWAPEAYHN